MKHYFHWVSSQQYHSCVSATTVTQKSINTSRFHQPFKTVQQPSWL